MTACEARSERRTSGEPPQYWFFSVENLPPGESRQYWFPQVVWLTTFPEPEERIEVTTMFELRPLETAPFHLRELVEAGCFCSGCGRQLRSFSEHEVTRRRFRRLISVTIDGKILISSKLVPALAACGLSTSDDLLPLSPIADLFWLRP